MIMKFYRETTWGVFTWRPICGNGRNGIKIVTSTYTQIMGVNAVLDGVDDVEGSVEKKEVVKAQALGLRAYYYFYVSKFVWRTL